MRIEINLMNCLEIFFFHGCVFRFFFLSICLFYLLLPFNCSGTHEKYSLSFVSSPSSLSFRLLFAIMIIIVAIDIESHA